VKEEYFMMFIFLVFKDFLIRKNCCTSKNKLIWMWYKGKKGGKEEGGKEEKERKKEERKS
jgi:hypothetical protein